ncbi:phosphatidylglycerophosphatase B [Clostridia bacterium]|nr:phosphatidylglycerophosphatase B [Clostridia bacterium]
MPFEIEIIKFLQTHGNAFLTAFFKVISFIAYGNWCIFAAILVLMLAFLLYKLHKKQKIKNILWFILIFAVIYAVALLINTALKFLIARPRPYKVDGSIIDFDSAAYESMPSGHTISAVVLCCFVFEFFVLFLMKKHAHKVILAAVLAVFIVSVVFSRMYLGQHYLTDTLVAILCGAGWSVLGITVHRKKVNNSPPDPEKDTESN